MDEVGVFPPDTRVELIDGEFLRKQRQSDRHYACINNYTEELTSVPGKSWRVSVNNPLLVSDVTLPLPDVVLLRRDATYGIPNPATSLVVIEVVDLVPEYDFNVKAPLYAEARIQELWLTDLHHDRIVIFTEPAGQHYEQMRAVGRGDVLTSPRLPELTLSVDLILPKR